MSNLANAIKHIYPTIDLETQCIIQNDGLGSYIAQWNDSRPQPTDSELVSADLAVRKNAIADLIDAERNRREQDVFTYQGKQIQCDKDSITRMSIAGLNALIAIQTNNPFNIDWLCVDKTNLTLDAVGMSGMIVSLGMHGAALHYYARALKNEVAAATDPESIDIYAGWPV